MAHGPALLRELESNPPARLIALPALRPAPSALLAALVCLSYVVGAEIGFGLRLPPATPSVVWPPNSILTTALLLTPVSRWWIVLLAALPLGTACFTLWLIGYAGAALRPAPQDYAGAAPPSRARLKTA